jgi:nucleotide-binding universal stress UspA family protein
MGRGGRYRRPEHQATVSFVIRHGRPTGKLSKVAEPYQCNLILMGSREQQGVLRISMGETGNEMVPKAPVPVIGMK